MNTATFALITGASKGIGKEMALELASRGHNILLVARSADLLNQLAAEIESKHKVKCISYACDLSAENAADLVYQFCKDNQIEVNILINNAGYGLWGKFDSLSLESQLNMLHLNMQSPVKLIYKFLPMLKAQKRAYILNVGSTASYQAVPTLSLYSASKAFMVLFSRGLRMELKDSNVSVTVVSPGATETNFMERAGMNSPKIIKNAEKFNMKPNVVAKFAIEGMFKGKNEIIPGFTNAFSVKMTYFLPKSLIENIAASLYK
jgi:short-subunit dehydrogenase